MSFRLVPNSVTLNDLERRNTNRHPIAYPFEVIADYCANFGRKRPLCVFLAPKGFGATHTVHLRLTGKLVVDFRFVRVN